MAIITFPCIPYLNWRHQCTLQQLAIFSLTCGQITPIKLKSYSTSVGPRSGVEQTNKALMKIMLTSVSRVDHQIICLYAQGAHPDR